MLNRTHGLTPKQGVATPLTNRIKMLRYVVGDNPGRLYTSPLLSPGDLHFMTEYLLKRGEKRGDGDTITKADYVDRFRWMTETIEQLLIKYGANCFHPVHLMRLIDTIHDCKAEDGSLREYNVTLFDVAYQTARYVIEDGRERGQSQKIDGGEGFFISIPAPSFDIQVLSPTTPTHALIEDDTAKTTTISSEDFQSGSEFRLPDVEKRDLDVISGLNVSASPITSLSASEDSGSELLSPLQGNPEGTSPDASPLQQEASLNTIRDSINFSPTKPRANKNASNKSQEIPNPHMLNSYKVYKSKPRVAENAHMLNYLKTFPKKPLVASNAHMFSYLKKYPTEPIVADHASSQSQKSPKRPSLSALKPHTIANAGRPGPAIRAINRAVINALMEDAIAAPSATSERMITAKHSKKPTTNTSTVPQPPELHSGVVPTSGSTLKPTSTDLVPPQVETTQKIISEKETIVVKAKPDCVQGTTTGSQFGSLQATVESEEEYSPVFGSSKRKMSDGAQPYEPVPSTKKKALRTTKRANTTAEQTIILSDELDEDKEDPSFVPSAIPSVCKKLRCKVDRCHGEHKEPKKVEIMEKRVTRAMTQTKPKPKGKGKGKKSA